MLSLLPYRTVSAFWAGLANRLKWLDELRKWPPTVKLIWRDVSETVTQVTALKMRRKTEENWTSQQSIGVDELSQCEIEETFQVMVHISDTKSILKGRMKDLVAWREICAFYRNKVTVLHFFTLTVVSNSFIRTSARFEHKELLPAVPELWMYGLWRTIHYKMSIKWGLHWATLRSAVVKLLYKASGSLISIHCRKAFLSLYYLLMCYCSGVSTPRRQVSPICWLIILVASVLGQSHNSRRFGKHGGRRS